MSITKRKGFTLIELLVVIAIIGILATIITAALGSARAKGRDARRIADIKVIQTALQLYYNDNGMYPTNIYCPSSGGTGICGSAAPATGLAPSYIASVAVDPGSNISAAACVSAPKTAGCYKYSPLPYNRGSVSCSAGLNAPSTYHIGAVLEVTAAAPQGVGADGSTDACRPPGTYYSDFAGKSASCSGTGSSDAGAGNYNCYDQKP